MRTPVWIIYPRDVNWFYEHAARRMDEGLRLQGVSTTLCAAGDFARAGNGTAGTVLIVSLGECLASLPAPHHADTFLGALRRYERRILLNYDCIYSEWFHRHFSAAPGIVTEIADVNVVPQIAEDRLAGVPYRWIPESLTASERATMRPWTPERPLPWAFVGHDAPSRGVLLDCVVRSLGTGGLAFLPALRPYLEGSGTLTGRSLDRVLEHSQLYIWNSHHEYPFHEGVRAPHALRNGAIPAKIDPLFSHRFAGVPWVFPDVHGLKAAVEALGLRAFYERCRSFLLSRSMEAELAAFLKPRGASL
jgi:hypothetical protein